MLNFIYVSKFYKPINLFFILSETLRSFKYSIANCKFDVTCQNESFLSKSTSSTVNIKTGLSKRKPVFLDSRTLDDWGQIKYITSPRGNKLLYFEGHRFIKNNIYGSNIYWKCTKWHNNCKARAITCFDVPSRCILKGVHNHPMVKDD